ncbi:MbtH protein [Streptomyces sp. 1114.5]|uniref:MbtH family protein n=1 Tax=Streptomyces sp. 1114.5 TaxID=1938830 RepID=UPI000EAFF21A|nr:MbtH family protein [Streptomyces sp. 1114.5]RKT19426.1 MbtH protein [Streptomyces sp. 1114.5]
MSAGTTAGTPAGTSAGTTNPFDVEDAEFLVLVDAQGRHSLWPAALPVPAGWTTAHGPADRAASLTYVNVHWTDLGRPDRLSGRPPGQPDN